MENITGVPQEAQERYADNLTPEYAAKLVFESLRFSQGEPFLQKNLFRYFHATHPNWELSDPETTRKIAHKRINAYMYEQDPEHVAQKVDSQLHTDTQTDANRDINGHTINAALDDTIDIANDSFGEEVDDNMEALLVNILHLTLLRDKHYLLSDQGRYRAKPDDTRLVTDPRSSFTIEYILRGRKTSIEEITSMFSAIKAYMEDPKNHKTLNWKTYIENPLKDVIKSYNDYNPTTRIAFPNTEDA